MATRRAKGTSGYPKQDPDYSAISTGSSPSGSDNESVPDPKTSTEQARIDLEVLDEEEERENLLAGRSKKDSSKLFTSVGKITTSRHQAQKYDDGKKELLYDTEEGGRGSIAPSLASSEEDREKISYTQSTARARKASLCARICKYTAINVLIAALFLAIALGAYKATRETRHRSTNTTYLSNGTHAFAPTTILLSLDGFRADFLQRDMTPVLNGFIREGVSPKYMLPSFPSVTFPNHYTMVTGLYPESHGVVGNTFWDPALQEEFYYTDPEAMKPKWWHGEPIWVTAEKQGVKAATHMWPGSEAHISDFEPTFVDKFNGSESLDRKASALLRYLDRPGSDSLDPDEHIDDQNPQMIIAYVPNVDADGHKYGPNSTEIKNSIKNVDAMFGNLLDGIKQRNLTEIVNIIVVSDHGMATTSTDRLIQFEDLIDPDLVEHIDGWPHYGLRPKDPSRLHELYDHLMTKAEERDGFDVYIKSTMPKRYHFTHNERIAPLWIIPHTGWAIVTHDELNVGVAKATDEVYHPRGIHGYDHEDPLMRAIFMARGPTFPHKPGSRLDTFQNTNVYNILCDSVGLEPMPNNGTLRLPLKPNGVHGEDVFEGEKPLSDPPSTAIKGNSTAPTSAGSTSTSTPTADPPDRPTIERPEDDDSHVLSWAEYMKAKAEAAKAWLSEKLGISEDKVAVEEVPPDAGRG